MPALIVLQVISLSLGFSRKLADVALRVGLDQAVGARVVDRREHDRRRALRSRWSFRTALRSTCVSTSPLKTTTDSVSWSPAYRIAPPVPSGIGSTT